MDAARPRCRARLLAERAGFGVVAAEWFSHMFPFVRCASITNQIAPASMTVRRVFVDLQKYNNRDFFFAYNPTSNNGSGEENEVKAARSH